MLHIVIPMAGRGMRFAGEDYALPKPMIEVLPGKRMVDFVLHYLSGREARRFVIVCLKAHWAGFDLDTFFRDRLKDHVLVTTEHVTQGPACTALLAEGHLGDKEELLIAYCDDYLGIRIDDVLKEWRARKADGGVLVFPSKSPANSYVRMDEAGVVSEVAEKKCISVHATVGLYYFREGGLFVRGAKRRVERDRRAKGEFFVSEVYNELIEDGKKVVALPIDAGANVTMGTPKELERALPFLKTLNLPSR